jgi:glycosyltransferase involved in cell wall biosynthesis
LSDSNKEGTPVALIEAMASCRPVVATAVGGVTDLLGGVKEKRPEGFLIAERGLMVETGDAKAMAQAFMYLSENPAALQPTIEKARKFVLTNYDQKRLINDIKMLYGELLGR